MTSISQPQQEIKERGFTDLERVFASLLKYPLVFRLSRTVTCRRQLAATSNIPREASASRRL